MKVGETIAGYELVAHLASGGMAALYLGRKSGLGGFEKYAAIKVVHDQFLGDDAFEQMFLDEARVSAAIEHPNVVTVFDMGQAKGHYFMVMEYVPSLSLLDAMRQIAQLKRSIEPNLAVWIAASIAAGLHAAHECRDAQGEPLNIIHRDVSPKNILLAYKGYVKLIDFGIAKAAGQLHVTKVKSIKGTVCYMSPEQATTGPIDRRSDIYALGIVLWELLTLRELFTAENDVKLLQLVRTAHVPAMAMPRVSPALEQCVRRALCADPNDRFSTAAEFREALLAVQPGARTVRSSDVAELVGTLAARSQTLDRKLDEAVRAAIGRPQVGRDALATLTYAKEDTPSLGAAPSTPPVLSRSSIEGFAPQATTSPSAPATSPPVIVPNPEDFDDADTVLAQRSKLDLRPPADFAPSSFQRASPAASSSPPSSPPRSQGPGFGAPITAPNFFSASTTEVPEMRDPKPQFAQPEAAGAKAKKGEADDQDWDLEAIWAQTVEKVRHIKENMPRWGWALIAGALLLLFLLAVFYATAEPDPLPPAIPIQAIS